MKEWIMPIIVITGLIAVGFGVRTLILKRSTNTEQAADTADEEGLSSGLAAGGLSGNPSEEGSRPPQQPRIDPATEDDWEQQHHPFVGYPAEPAPAAEIQRGDPPGEPRFGLEEMVTIAAGDFVVGDDDLAYSSPERRIHLSTFQIDRYEVSREQYRAFLEATEHRQPEQMDDYAKHSSWHERTYPAGTGSYPVVLVSYVDAEAYCKWAGKRLPTEEEWEKAARGSQGFLYPWGNDWDGRKAHTVERLSGPLASAADWHTFDPDGGPAAGGEGQGEDEDDEDVGPFPVGSYPEDASGYGVFGMHGNVSEWTQSAFVAYPGTDESATNLYGDGSVAVVRGNSFCNRDYAAPVAVRYPYPKAYASDHIGFRCAMDP